MEKSQRQERAPADEMCCNGKGHKEGFGLRLKKLLRRSDLEYRAVPAPDDLFTIRRYKRAFGVHRDRMYQEWCQCGRWVERDGVSDSHMAPQTFASGTTADTTARRLGRGFPTSLEVMAAVFALVVTTATVVSAVADVMVWWR